MTPTTLQQRLEAIDQMLVQWRPKLLLFGLGGLVEQIVALLRELVREVEGLKLVVSKGLVDEIVHEVKKQRGED